MTRKVTSSDETVGARLRLRRKQYAASEQQLAKILGVRVQDIQDYESGAARLGAVRLGNVSKALDAPIGYFFTRLGPVNSLQTDKQSDERLLTLPGAAELLSAYSGIASSQLRGAVLKLVLHLARESRGCVSPTLAKTPLARRSNSRAR
jgi:transcriptional regulator with XRE-family HTH domain